MKTQYTSGPWCIESDGTTISMAGQCVIVSPAPDGASRDECRANARLIASAPELLEALEAIVANDFAMTVGAKIIIRAAIAKATGGQP